MRYLEKITDNEFIDILLKEKVSFSEMYSSLQYFTRCEYVNKKDLITLKKMFFWLLNYSDFRHIYRDANRYNKISNEEFNKCLENDTPVTLVLRP